MLDCAECGCSSDDEARGWVAFLGDDTDGEESTSIAVLCPVCASSEFGYRPDQADAYT